MTWEQMNMTDMERIVQYLKTTDTWEYRDDYYNKKVTKICWVPDSYYGVKCCIDRVINKTGSSLLDIPGFGKMYYDVDTRLTENRHFLELREDQNG